MVDKRSHDEMLRPTRNTRSDMKTRSLHKQVKRRRINRNKKNNKCRPIIQVDIPVKEETSSAVSSPRGVDDSPPCGPSACPYDSLYNDMNSYVQMLQDCRPFYGFDAANDCCSCPTEIELPPRLDDALQRKNCNAPGEQEEKTSPKKPSQHWSIVCQCSWRRAHEHFLSSQIWLATFYHVEFA